MATYLNVKRAERFVDKLKRLNKATLNHATSIAALEAVYDSLDPADQTEVNGVLQELGYSLSDLNSYWTEVKAVKTYIQANVNEMEEPNF